MKYVVKGAFRETGNDTVRIVEAVNQQDAEEFLHRQGIIIASLKPLDTATAWNSLSQNITKESINDAYARVQEKIEQDNCSIKAFLYTIVFLVGCVFLLRGGCGLASPSPNEREQEAIAKYDREVLKPIDLAYGYAVTQANQGDRFAKNSVDSMYNRYKLAKDNSPKVSVKASQTVIPILIGLFLWSLPFISMLVVRIENNKKCKR